MKKIGVSLLERYGSLPMQKKMLYAYAIPVILICIIVNMLCFPIINERYTGQLKYTVKQSVSQTEKFMLNYIENMYYISQLIADNGVIRDTLLYSEQNIDRSYDEQYRDYWKLADTLANIELSNAKYRVGIYVPDHYAYSNNNYYFFKESALKERNDYQEIMKNVSSDKLYFSLIDEKMSYNIDYVETYIALFL